MVTRPKCPDCGSSKIVRRRDAWEVRALRGFREDGSSVLGENSEFELFDDIHFECDYCGYKGTDETEFDSDLTK